MTINSLLTGSIATERLASLAGSMENAEAAPRPPFPPPGSAGPRRWRGPPRSWHRNALPYITGAALAVDGGALRGI